MTSGFVNTIKQICKNVMDNSQLTDLRTGTVLETNPLQIQVSKGFVLPDEVLIIPESLTDHMVTYIPSSSTAESRVKVKAALQKGDRVMLVRLQGGKSYYVLDRLTRWR